MSSTTTTAPTDLDPARSVISNGSTTVEKSDETAIKVSSEGTKVDEIGYPNGHLGYLTQEQENALAEFRKILAAEGLYTAGTNGSRPSHADSVLLKFLRARRYIPQDALGQFKDTEQWRKLNELDDLYLNIDVEDYEETMRHVSQQQRTAGNAEMLKALQSTHYGLVGEVSFSPAICVNRTNKIFR